MKKIIFLFLFCFGLCFMSSAAYADQTESTQIEITGGINFDKERISTFDDSKIISGNAQSGTTINITVYSVNSRGNLRESESYDIEVGKSGIFSQGIQLKVGENVVALTAHQENCEDFYDELEINRKQRNIKYQLETGIYLPGGGI